MRHDDPGLDEYSGFAKLLHWVTAVLVFAIIPVGVVMQRLAPGEERDSFFSLHRSLGVVILMLVVLSFCIPLHEWRAEPLPRDQPL